jgi:tetratricopeptide (TPR) repeat protein
VLYGKEKALEAIEHSNLNLNQSNIGQAMGYFRFCQIRNDTSGMHYFYNQFLKATENLDEKTTWVQFLKSVLFFRIGKIKEAEHLLSRDLPVVDRQRRIHMLGLLYAATGRKELAQQVVADLLEHETKFDNGVTRYYAGKVEAGIGNKEMSVNYLREAIAKGCEFREDLFQFDADLVNLFDYPPFVELVTPKE